MEEQATTIERLKASEAAQSQTEPPPRQLTDPESDTQPVVDLPETTPAEFQQGILRRVLHSTVTSWLMAVVAAAIAGFHYVRTVHPGVGPFLDSVEYQTTIATFGISHPPGYPLYTFLGKAFTLIPWGWLLSPLSAWNVGQWGDNLAWRLNLLSSFAAMITVLLTVRLVHRLTKNTIIAFLAGLTLAGAVRFWFQASYTELYAVYTMMIVAVLLTLIAWIETRQKRYYFASAFLFALSFGVNVPAIVLLPAWLWGVLSVDYNMLLRPRYFGATVATVFLAASIYFYIPLRALVFGVPAFCNYCPTTWGEVPAFLTGQVWRDQGIAFGVEPQFWLQRSADSGYQLMLNFWPIGVILGAVGLAYLLHTNWRVGGIFTLGLLGTWIFVITYNVVDWSDFMTPVYVLYAPLIGVGMAAVWQWYQTNSATWRTHTHLARPLQLLQIALVLGLGIYVFLALRPYPIADYVTTRAVWFPLALLLLLVLWLATVLSAWLEAVVRRQPREERAIPQRSLRLLGGWVLFAIPVVLVVATFFNNYSLVDQSGNMIWHWWARDLLTQVEDDAWLLAPPPQTDGFAQSWALRFVAWSEDVAPGLQMVYPPIDENPPGPPPGYLLYESVQAELADHPLYAIELNDERLHQYALLPLVRDDGWTIGYQIVGERSEDGIVPWVSAERWAEIEFEVILP